MDNVDLLGAFGGLIKIHQVFDQAQVFIEKQLGVPICLPNCGICCSDNTVTAHSIEASLILSQLIGNGQLHFIDQCRDWLISKDHRITIYKGIPTGLISGELRQEWNEVTHNPCLFLMEDKRCAIHDVRPLPCRAFGVTKVAPMYCLRPVGKGESNCRLCVNSPKLRDATQGLLKAFKEKNPEWIRMGFLPTMLYRAAKEKDFRELIAENKIPSAKLVGTDYSTQALWQDDDKLQGATKDILSKFKR